MAAGLLMAGTLLTAHAAEVDYKLLPNFGVSVGEPFPLDALVDPEGKATGRDRWLGKRVLINFYTRHCAPCIKEVPKLNEVMKRRGDIHVLAITPDSGVEAAKYAKQHGLNWPVAADAESLLFKQLKVMAFPAFALLDDKGRLMATVQANQLGGEDGHATVAGIETWLDTQLAKAAN
jgi:peroxiredoxin